MKFETPSATIRGEKAAFLCGEYEGMSLGIKLLADEIKKIFPKKRIIEIVDIAVRNVLEEHKLIKLTGMPKSEGFSISSRGGI
jgi:hypothetical protein